jgi:hypothetical protein
MPELMAPSLRLHESWLCARNEWDSGEHQPGSGLHADDDVDTAKGFARLQRPTFGPPAWHRNLGAAICAARSARPRPSASACHLQAGCHDRAAGVAGAGPSWPAIQQVGLAKFDEVMTAALADLLDPQLGIRLTSEFFWMTARKPG